MQATDLRLSTLEVMAATATETFLPTLILAKPSRQAIFMSHHHLSYLLHQSWDLCQMWLSLTMPSQWSPNSSGHMQCATFKRTCKSSITASVLENCFGILTQLWRVYCWRQQACSDAAASIVKATCIPEHPSFNQELAGEQGIGGDPESIRNLWWFCCLMQFILKSVLHEHISVGNCTS